MSRHIRSVRYRTATHVIKSTQARHTRVAQLVSLEIMDGTYESIYLVAFILAGSVYNNALKNRAALLCRACVDETTCVAERYPALRIGFGMGAHCAPLRKKKSSAVPLFAAVTYRQSAPD